MKHAFSFIPYAEQQTLNAGPIGHIYVGILDTLKAIDMTQDLVLSQEVTEPLNSNT